MKKMNSLFESSQHKENDTPSHYASKILTPQYEPKNTKPNIVSLCDLQKYSKLLHDINNSNVSDEEKKFLRFAASRHIAFNYALIADYYAHSDPEMQRLMEQSALVILDIDDAIANGYVRLSSRIEKLLGEVE